MSGRFLHVNGNRTAVLKGFAEKTPGSGLTRKDFIHRKGRWVYKTKSLQAQKRWRAQMRNPAFARQWKQNTIRKSRKSRRQR